MALKANRTGTVMGNQGVATAPNAPAPVPTASAPAPTVPAPVPTATHTPAPTVPAPVPATKTPAVAGGTTKAILEMNQGVLDFGDDVNFGGNWVAMDGTNFLYKASGEETPTIDVVITRGERYYQWVDESDQENKVYHKAPYKVDDRYSERIDITWEEVNNETGDMEEFTMSLPTSSAISFKNYVKMLSTKHGKGVNAVVTRLSISRQTRRGSTDRYSRCEFSVVERTEPQA